jgi:aminobenzoyl-glutamate transport protein
MLPHPVYIFLILTVVVVLVSMHMGGMTFHNPGNGKEEVVKNLATPEGFRWMLQSMVNNFTRFPPLGTVLVMMIGLGLAEEAGLLRAVLRKAIAGAPRILTTTIVVFAGVMGNIAGSATFVVIPPLGGLVFKSLNRHPLAGIAAGFAGVAAGLSANLLITPTDILCAGLTEKAMQIMVPNATVHPAVNWYFMFLATIVLTVVGVFITEKLVEPSLGTYDGSGGEVRDEDTALMEVTEAERRGMRNALIVTLLYVCVIALMVVPADGILRDPKLKTIVPSPFLSSMVPILFLWFFLVALAYGITAGTIRNSGDVIKHMTESMKGFAGFIVLCFFAAQFVEYFSYTNLGLLLAVKGADYLQSSGFIGVPLIVAFIILAALINFLIGSASAKWAILAPIFVPMFMKLNFSPYLTQAAYRVADSVTNCVSPLEPFMPFIIICAQRYDKKAGLGTIISIMIPYAIFFMISWTLLLIGFYLLNLPLGPGAPVLL